MRWLVALAGLGLLAQPARAEEPFLVRLAQTVRARLEAASLARGPKLVPPVPVAVKWKATRIGSLELGAPLVALVAGDLDGNGKGELYAVTSREVIALSLLDGKAKELGRVAFGGEPAVPAPRDVVGAAVIDNGVLLAHASSWAHGLRVHWRGKTLVGEPGDSELALCPGERAKLAPGRNYFGEGGAKLYAVRCRYDLVDPTGRTLHVRGELTIANKLELQVTTCAGAACEPPVSYDFAGVGVAFEIADVDHDGHPEVIVSGAGAPGDADAVKVMTLGGDDKKPSFRKTFTGGVVGLAAIDAGAGAAWVIAAVRLVGANRVDLWRLD